MTSSIEKIYGDLPPDWGYFSLGDLIAQGKANLQTGPFGTLLQASEYQSSGTPVIAVQNIGDNRINRGTIPKISEETVTRLAGYKLCLNDILFCRKGYIERRAIIRKEEVGWLQGSDCIRLRFGDSLDALSISYVLGKPAYRSWIFRHAQGATMPSLNQEILKLIPLPLPPLPIQSRIAHILGSLDDKIELNRQMNETLEAMARAIFKSWFVDFDPVRAKAEGRQPEGMDTETAALFPDGFEEVDGREVPKGWRIGTVNDLGDIICGKTPPTKDPDNYGNDMLFITIPDMHNQIFILNTNKKLSEIGVRAQWTKTLPPMSICVSCIATPGLVTITCKPSQTNQQINSVIPFNQKSVYYCYYVLLGLSDEIISSGSGGSVVDNLNKRDFSSLSVLLPTESIIQSFNNQVKSLFLKILVNQEESRTLVQIRDTLLPKLMNGEMAVKG